MMLINKRYLARPFMLGDPYARYALGRYHQVGSSFADLDVTVGARGLSQTAVPEIDDDVLEVVGDVDAEVELVRITLLSHRRDHDLFPEPTLPMELQSWLSALVEEGDIYYRLSFARVDADRPYRLVKVQWVAPETIVERRDSTREPSYEQFASRRAYEGDGYTVTGEPIDHLYTFAKDEIVHLRWPLREPGGRAPQEVALKLGRKVARASEEELLRAHALANPDESYLPLARAGAGAFNGALDRQKLLSARIRDQLFYPGSYESEVFPWADDLTDYFAADRIIRGRIAICQLRDYLFGQFNEQVLDPWRQRNGWSNVRLRLRPQLLSIGDWQALQGELEAGRASIDDVRAAAHAEADTASAYGRLARQRAEGPS